MTRPADGNASESRAAGRDDLTWAAWRGEVVHGLEQAIAESELPPPLHDAIRYGSTVPKASRWRSLLVLQVGSTLGVEPAAALLAAVAVEALHCATLSVDDLPCMDNAAQRRGVPALHRRFNEAVAIQASLWLVGISRTLMARATTVGSAAEGPHDTAARLASLQQRTENDLQLGQFLDMMGTLGRMEIDVEEVARLKCGRLFALAAHAPTLLGSMTRPLTHLAAALDRFGERVGLAYQVLDDLEDLAADDAATTWGGDEKGRPTIVGRFGVDEARCRVDAYLAEALAAIAPLAASGVAIAPLEHLARVVLGKRALTLGA